MFLSRLTRADSEVGRMIESIKIWGEFKIRSMKIRYKEQQRPKRLIYVFRVVGGTQHKRIKIT